MPRIVEGPAFALGEIQTKNKDAITTAITLVRKFILNKFIYSPQVKLGQAQPLRRVDNQNNSGESYEDGKYFANLTPEGQVVEHGDSLRMRKQAK